MKLTHEGQKKIYFNRLWDITVQSYSLTQTPTEEKFSRVLKEGDVFVADSEEGTVGYALVSPSPGTPFLRSIAVYSAYRGRGFGSALLNEVADFYRAKGCSRLLLHVMVHNPAQKLYFANGYRVTKVLKDYYAPEGDGLEMEKVL